MSNLVKQYEEKQITKLTENKVIPEWHPTVAIPSGVAP